MPRSCQLEDCTDPYLARGLCNRHYLQWKNYIGRPDPKPPAWTPEEDHVLLAAGLTPHTERWSGESRLQDVARELGRSEVACRSRLNRLMKRAGHQGGQWTTEGLWTAEEDEVIREAATHDRPGWASVAADLGRTPGACVTRAYNLRKRDRLAS